MRYTWTDYLPFQNCILTRLKTRMHDEPEMQISQYLHRCCGPLASRVLLHSTVNVFPPHYILQLQLHARQGLRWGCEEVSPLIGSAIWRHRADWTLCWDDAIGCLRLLQQLSLR